jgi:hypothetical protein
VGRVSSPRYALRFSDADQPFGLRVDSQGVNGAVAAWDSMDMPLVFKDQYIQVTSRWAHARPKGWHTSGGTQLKIAMT